MFNWAQYSTSASTSTWDTSSNNGGYFYYTMDSYSYKIKDIVKEPEPEPPKELFFDPKNIW